MKRPFAIESIGFRRWQVTEKATKKVIGVYRSRDAAGDIVRKLQEADAIAQQHHQPATTKSNDDVTPAMISAGLDAYFGCLSAEETAENTVKQIYLEMLHAMTKPYYVTVYDGPLRFRY